MASSKEYLNFILDQLSGLNGISYRAMMGEYIIYYNGKIVGGIYDDRLLIKPVGAAIAMLPDAKIESPYEGSRCCMWRTFSLLRSSVTLCVPLLVARSVEWVSE